MLSSVHPFSYRTLLAAIARLAFACVVSGCIGACAAAIDPYTSTPSVEGYIAAMIADAEGRVYAGGEFTSIGGVAALNVAMWDGTTWKPLGEGVNGRVNALAFAGNELVAGGQFTKAGPRSANCIARWSGDRWQSMGGVNGEVRALASAGSSVYVAGDFTSADGTPANHLAHWNGLWEAVGDLKGPVLPYITAMTVWFGDLYIGGIISGVEGLPEGGIARWSRSNNEWSPLGAGIAGSVSRLAVCGNYLIVGGSFTEAGGKPLENLAAWSGIDWSSLGSKWPAHFFSMNSLGSELFLGCDSSVVQANGRSSAVWKWNGQTWSTIDTGIQGIAAILPAVGNELFAWGSIKGTAGGTETESLVRWDGTQLAGFRSGLIGSIQTVMIRDGDIVAGGDFRVYTPGEKATRGIGRWDGKKWNHLDGGINGTVTVLHGAGEKIFAGGSFDRAGSVPAANIAQWAGEGGWKALGIGSDSMINAIASAGPNAIYAGSSSGASKYAEFKGVGGLGCVAQWDGTKWVKLGHQLLGSVECLGLAGGDLYAAGSFSAAYDPETGGRGMSLASLARRTNFDWTGLANSNPSIPRFWICGNTVYATLFRSQSPAGAYFHRLQGFDWIPVGDVAPGLLALEQIGPDLYCTDGNRVFRLINGHWTIQPSSSHVYLGGRIFTPNPFGPFGTPSPNQPPYDIHLMGDTFPEIGIPYMTPVGWLKASDFDDGDSHTFLDSSQSDYFLVTRDGAVFARGSQFDFETRSTYPLTVRATDSGGLSLEKTLTIKLSNVPEPPVLQPTTSQEKKVKLGESVEFSVRASGEGQLFYQWYRNDIPLSDLNSPHIGANSPDLRLSNVQLIDEGIYYCAVTSDVWPTPILTAKRKLTVLLPPALPQIPPGEPQDKRVLEGETVSFSIHLLNSGPYFFEWLENGVPLHEFPPFSGTRTSTLTIQGVSPAEAAVYSVKIYINDGIYPATSVLGGRGATLTVVSPPKIMAVTEAGSRFAGEPYAFTVWATGTEPLRYQWRKSLAVLFNDGRISGADGPELSFSHLLISDPGDYSVVVSNEAGEAISEPVSLGVLFFIPPPGFIREPSGKTAAVGSSVTFSAEIFGGFPMTNQWRKCGELIGEPILMPREQLTNLVKLTLPGVKLSDKCYYDLVISNPSGSMTSAPVSLVVLSPPMITESPRNQSISVGASASFNVTATGREPFSYQWRKGEVDLENNEHITGAKTATLTLANVQLSDEGNYDVVITNADGGTTSLAATLAVNRLSRSLQTCFPFNSSVQDTSGNNRVPLVNGATLTVDRNGKPDSAYAFHGDSLVSVPNIDPDNYAEGFSFGFWIKPANGIGSPAYWVQDADWGSTYFILQGRLRLGSGSPATAYEGVGNLTVGQWQHVFVTHDATFDRLYVNGVKIFEGSARLLRGNVSTLTMGADGFEGDLDEFAVFGRGLEPAEVQAVFEGGLNPVPPEITAQPTHRTVIAGEPAQFAVIATGSEPLAYQWRRGDAALINGGNISGADTSTLRLASAQAADAGNYSVVVTNVAGIKTSDMVTLTVEPPKVAPTISQPPQNLTVPAGRPAQFTVVATGTEPFSYQWRKGGVGLMNGGNISDAHTATLRLNSTEVTDAGSYEVRVSNEVGFAESAATLSVIPRGEEPRFTAHPQDLRMFEGANAGFSAIVSNGVGVDYQWWRDEKPVVEGGRFRGAKLPTLQIEKLIPDDAGAYRLVATSAGAITSRVATLTVRMTPPMNQRTNFTVLHVFDESFWKPVNTTGTVGSGLIEGSDGWLYGTTRHGGTNRVDVFGALGVGTLYRIRKDGSDFTIVHHFGGDGDGSYDAIWTEPLEASDGVLYGVTYAGGSVGSGYVYRINKDGSGFNVLHNFGDGSIALDGARSTAPLLDGPDGMLYGITRYGGERGQGALFRLAKDGSGYQLLRSFGESSTNVLGPTGLIFGRDGILFGTGLGGLGGYGTVFKINRDGTDLQILADMVNWNDRSNFLPGNPLQASDGLLYGMSPSDGRIYQLNPETKGFTLRPTFPTDGSGGEPRAALIESRAGHFVSPLIGGGVFNAGAIASFAKDGTAAILHPFNPALEPGGWPRARLLEASDGALYGTTGMVASTPENGGHAMIYRLTWSERPHIRLGTPSRRPGGEWTIPYSTDETGAYTLWRSSKPEGPWISAQRFFNRAPGGDLTETERGAEAAFYKLSKD